MQFQRKSEGSHNRVALKDKDEESFFFTVWKLCVDTSLDDASYLDKYTWRMWDRKMVKQADSEAGGEGLSEGSTGHLWIARVLEVVVKHYYTLSPHAPRRPANLSANPVIHTFKTDPESNPFYTTRTTSKFPNV